MIHPTKTLSTGIDCRPDEIYEFVFNPENLPRWATAFCTSVSRSADGWTMETPQGSIPIRFVERNRFGVLDHYVTPAPGIEIHVPMRVMPNGSGSEVTFTMFRAPGTTDEQFAADAAVVERDLNTLKSVLESGGCSNA